MADITRLGKVEGGSVKNQDLTTSTPVVQSIKVGGVTNTELTKTALDSLISNSHAASSDNQNVVAGSGLSGGGSGATVNLAVDSTVVRTNGANAFSADQSMGSNKLTNLANGAAAQDAVAFGQLASYIPTSEKGANSGVATLDAGGKVPVTQLPNAVMTFEGTWAASTNTPTLANGTGNAGMVYVASDAGTVNFGAGNITFAAGDWVVYNASGIWEKSVNSNAVASVNGQTGVVVVNAISQLTGDITAGPASGSQSQAATIANSAVTLSKLASNAVDENKIVSTALDSNGALSGGSGTKLSVNVDNTTIGIVANTLVLLRTGTVARVYSVGEAFVAGQPFAVRMAINGETEGKLYKADPDTTTSDLYHVVGIIDPTVDLAINDAATVIMLGLDSNNFACSGADIGKPVFLSTGGTLTMVAPTTANHAVVKVGIANTTSTLLVTGTQVIGIN